MSRTMPKLRLPAAIIAAAVCALLLSAAGAVAKPIAAYTTKGAWTFVSAPNLHPPMLHTSTKTQFSKLAPGYFMVANFKNQGSQQPLVGQSGPLILDHNLQPVWFNPSRREHLRGQPQGAELQRQAGAQLVAGRGDRIGSYDQRRGRRRRPALPARRDAEGRGRLDHLRARDDHQRRQRLGHRLQERPDEPDPVRRLGQRHVARLGRAGVQPRDRPARSTPGTRSTRAGRPTSRCRSRRRRRSPEFRGTPTTSTRSS